MTEHQFPNAIWLQQLSELTDDIMFVYHSGDNKLLFLNEAFVNIWGEPREVFLNDASQLAATIHPEDIPLVEKALIAIRQNGKHAVELRLPMTDGSQKWIHVKAFLSKQNNEEVITGTVTNITALKEYGNTLYKFANKKNSVLEILSHDLVSPLANIQMCADALRNHLNKADDELIKRMLNLITESSTRSIKMIRDLVNRELLESSEAPLILQRTDLIKRINEVIEQYHKTYQTIKQEVHFISERENLYITLDETKFMQVINNLLSNSLKFTRDEDKITITVEDFEKEVFIKIADTGVGIPAEIQPFIFDKFTKARREGIHGEPTTGLGLSIIKTIIEWHNGQIWFESTEGKGTTFFIKLPKNL